MNECVFCWNKSKLEEKALLRNEHHFFVKSNDPVLQDSGMIIPIRHVETPFELSTQEWSSLQQILLQAKDLLDTSFPDGYNLGWNVGETGGQKVNHCHLHIIARFKDEPLAGKGIRDHIRAEANKRQPKR